MLTKRLGTVLFALIAISFTTLSQNKDYPVSIGIFGGPVDFIGEIDSHTLFDFGGDETFFHFGAELGIYVNPSFDFAINVSTGEIGHKGGMGEFKADMTALDFQLKYKLNNGHLFKEDAKIAPYVLAGGGMTDISGDTLIVLDNLVGQFSWGAGIKIPISQRLSFDLRNTFRYTSSDQIDRLNSGLNDNYMTLTAGLKLNLGAKKDTDGDGITDKEDACPEVKGLAALNGCPDSDGDGITDAEDECPDAPGSAEMKGCPDGDNDGVADKHDTCPDEKGLAAFAGCPDRDDDGIMDKEDVCPDVAGLKEFNGCKDTDGDGISDDKDTCPNDAGSEAMKGCPDRDGDGVADNLDKCPDVAGIAKNKGCPEVSAAVKQVFTKALQGIQFESGKDIIKPSYFGILNNVSDIMKENTAYKLFIQGHTDSQGDDAINQDLSDRRAAAVMTYIDPKGIERDRMRSQGFGERTPVADNLTAAGRAKNRRVEFTVEF
jgi:OmpA-OmpF porin, OOP family